MLQRLLILAQEAAEEVAPPMQIEPITDPPSAIFNLRNGILFALLIVVLVIFKIVRAKQMQ